MNLQWILVFAASLMTAVVLGIAAAPAARAEDKPAPAQASPAFLVVTHEVQDFDRWKVAFDSTAALKRTFGWRQSTIYSVDGDRNKVTVIEEFGSLDGAKAFSQLSELKAAMTKGGVVGVPEIHFVSAVAHARN